MDIFVEIILKAGRSAIELSLFVLLPVMVVMLAIMRLLEAKGIIIGSSTHNNSVLKTIGGFLTYLQGLKPTGKLCSSFGAYGWAGGADKTLAEVLAKTDMEVEPGLFVKWTPDKVEINQCFEFGVAFGEKILNK